MNDSPLAAWYLGLAKTGRLMACLLAVLLLFGVDLLTDSEVSFSIFYLLPVTLAAASVGKRAAVLMSLASGVAWVTADLLGGAHYSHPMIPIWNTAMRIMIFLLVAELVSKLLSARDASAQAQAVAEAATRAKTAFLANMSHEIRTPVSAIIGYGDLLLDPELDVSDRVNYVNTIRRNSAHLLTIINDILDLAKVESGLLEVERVECSPRQSANDAVSMMRVRAIEKKLQLEVCVEGRIPRKIRTDPTRLRQILLNLLSNSIKFTDQGGVRLVLKLATPPDHPNPRLRFEIVDTGIGMSAEQLSRIFEPFVQGDTSTTRRFGGTGLGLHISRRLAQKLGGEITVESSPGNSSTFALEIETGPLNSVDLVDPRAEAVDDRQAAKCANYPTLSGRVLLAEDGADNRALLTLYLHKAGAEVEIAENGRVACQMAIEARQSGTPFDIILMDMQMPELDGYGATSRLRTLGYKGTIIALTAHAMAQDRTQCLSAGCTDYLSKPVDRYELLELVKQYMDAPAGTGQAPAAEKPIALTEQPFRTPAAPSHGEGKVPVAIDPEIAPLVPALVAHAREACQGMAHAATHHDFKTIQVSGHQLAGAGGSYGFKELSEIGRALETAAEAQDAAAVPGLVHKLEACLDRIDAALSLG